MLKKTVVPLLIVVIFILSKCELYGQSDPLLRHAMVTIDPVSDFEAFKSSPLPDRINLTWNDNPAKWTVVQLHHPVFSPQIGRDEFEIREQWKPLFDKHQVDIVLTAHDHSYSRTNADSEIYYFGTQSGISGEDYFDPDSGTVYVNSHSGSKSLRLDRADWMARAGEDLQMYQIITIHDDTLFYETNNSKRDVVRCIEAMVLS